MPGLNFVKQNQPAMQTGDDAISGRLLAVDCFVSKFLEMMNEVTRFFAMAEGALVIAKRVRHCERSEAIPEAKVACTGNGLLRRRLLAMTKGR